MKTVLTEILYAMEKEQDTILVMIVGEGGSVPRGTGSMMLISPKGRVTGTIGGGAVEQRSMDMARELLEKKTCLLHEFLLRENKTEDIGMVCGGDVTVWFQYIAHGDKEWKKLLGEALAFMEERRKGWFVFNLNTGIPYLLDENASSEFQVEEYTGKRIKESFSIPLPIGERALIFGAGHIAKALVPLLSGVGFRPSVFDCREEYAVKSEFPQAETVICGDYEKISEYLDVTAEDYIVVMTNGHSHDFVVQEQLLRKETAYIGVIGSSRKTASVNARLMEAGISKEATDRVHTPIGTKIKAVTPAEIAISIAGEMIYVRALRREEEKV